MDSTDVVILFNISRLFSKIMHSQAVCKNVEEQNEVRGFALQGASKHLHTHVYLYRKVFVKK